MRVKSEKSNLNLLDNWGEKFLNNIVTQDETTLSKSLPESKRDFSQRRKFEEQSQIKMRFDGNQRRKFMLSVFGLGKKSF